MEKKTKNWDVSATAASPIKQRESETNQGRVIEKDQRQEKVTVDDEEEEEAESGGGGGGPQAATKKKQRGKYRQYEESQVIVEKIRSYRMQRHPDSEIMKLLEAIS